MNSKYADISNIDELKQYLETKGRNHECYYHYTSWDSFVKIYAGHSFLLTRGNSLSINDQQEALMKGSWEEWNKTYIGSFSYGHAENMAMWGLYGLPGEDAIRIEIPRKAMKRWIESITSIYVWNAGPLHSVEGKVRLTDIVYVNRDSDPSLLQLTHNNSTIRVSRKAGLHAVDREPQMTGYIKNYAWRYENEVRLHIRLQESTGYEKIKVDIPPDVIEEIQITTGPAFQSKGDNLYKWLQKEHKIHTSEFTNLVHYRPLCDFCRNAPFERRG